MNIGKLVVLINLSYNNVKFILHKCDIMKGE